MRRSYSVLFVLLLVFSIVFISCSNDVVPSVGDGTLVVKIAGGQAKGILPTVSMIVSEYELTIKNSSDEVVVSSSLDSSETSASFSVPSGGYSITIDAKNTDGTVIGTGTERLFVAAGETNTVTVTIMEIEGDGVFAVSINANDGYELTLKLFNSANEVKYSDDLSYSDGVYTTKEQISIDNGFYRFEIIRKDTGARVKSDSVRIVNGFTSTYSATFTFTSDGGISIVDEMISIPVINISLEERSLEKTDSLVASAEISGITGYSACWFVDGVAIGSFGDYDDLEYPLTDAEPGEHEVSLYVKNSQVMWSEAVQFIVRAEAVEIDLSTLSGSRLIEIDPEQSYTFTNMDDSSMYAIETNGDGSRSIGLSRGLDDAQDALILDTGSDRILIPDENRKNSGTGSSYIEDAVDGLIRIFKISIANPNLEGDLSIVFNEDDFSEDACAEWNERERNKAYVGAKRTQFYHVSFLAPAFRDLDRSRIFIIVEDQGGSNMGGTNWGIVTLGNGINMDSYPNMYMYDFSGVPFINIYHEVESYFTQDRWEQFSNNHERRNSISSVLVLNPVDLSYNEEVAFGNRDRIICIPQAPDDSEYVLETYGCDPGDMIQLTDIDGVDYGFAYCLDSNAENKSYLIGKITEDVFFDLEYSREEGGSFTLRKAGPEDVVQIIELDSPEYSDEEVISFSDFNRDFSVVLPVEGIDDYVPSNILVSISALDSAGNPAELDSVYYQFSSGHVGGIGYSTRSYRDDSCINHKVSSSDVLKMIKINLRKLGEMDVTLRIDISDGTYVFQAGERCSYQETFDCDTSQLTDKEFIIDMDTGDLKEINKNDIFWYVIEKSAYENLETTVLDAVLATEGLIESEGIRTDVTDFYANNSRTQLTLNVQTNRSGTSTVDKEAYFIYAQYTGDGTADLSTLKCSDLTELVIKKLTFLKGR